MADKPPDLTEIRAAVLVFSKLDDVEYAVRRKEKAEELGLDLGVLDKLVRDARKPPAPQCDEGPGRKIVFPKEEPWPEPVGLADVIDDISGRLTRLVVMKAEQKLAFILWCVFTHLLDCFEHSPRLSVTSAVLRSGKSRLLVDIGAELVHKPYVFVSLSAAGLFRMIEAHRPTILMDEADTYLNDQDLDLRAILNGGFNRGAYTLRVEDTPHGRDLRAYGVWSCLALGRIGHSTETIEDRSIPIAMVRKPHDVKVERLTRALRNELRCDRNRIARWAQDNAAALDEADPAAIPEALNDRAVDAWRPLIAIADLAGKTVGDLAREAAVKLSAANEGATQPKEIQALCDIRSFIESRPRQDVFTSQELAIELALLEDRPWAEYRGKDPITKHQLARLLGELGLMTAGTDKDKTGPRGYTREKLDRYFLRYLPPVKLVQSSNSLEDKDE
jgi:hypothetical protein